MAALRKRRSNNSSILARPVRLAVAVLTILSLLPITWAVAFPEPSNRALCPPDREAPPRLAPEEEIQVPPTSPTPVVQILNPLPGAKVSDKYDGFDRRYHITAVAVGVPSDAVLEAVVQRGLSEEIVLGTLCPVEGTRDTFEGFWDIPDSFPEGSAEFVVNAFDRAGDGAQVVATDKVAIDVQHLAGGTAENEDVRLLWPPNDGPVGFFRNRAGEWKTSLQAIGAQVNAPQFSYSTTPLGAEPVYRPCASGSSVTSTTNRASDLARLWDFSCKLQAGDRPSAVTAIAAVAQGGQHSSDAHRVHPFLQTSSNMRVSIHSINVGAFNPLAPAGQYPSTRRRVAGTGCLGFVATVTDQFGRHVSGANVDVELRGPDEAAVFADPVDAAPPDNAPATEPAAGGCATSSPGTPHQTRQARFVVADGPDAKAIESITGTNDQGQWGFRIFSREPGIARIKAWVDDSPLESDVAELTPDNDQADTDEAFGEIAAHWLEAPMEVSLTPKDETSPVGTCRMYQLTLIAGTTGVTGFNVDFHVRIPDPEVHLCGTDDAPLHLPDAAHPTGAEHQPDEPGSLPGNPCPQGCHHLEGKTDEKGLLDFGLTSSLGGNASIIAWADGEPGEDADVQSSKPSATVLTRWVDEQSAGPKIRLVTPSSSFAFVSTNTARIVAEVGAAYLVDEVSIEVTSGTGKTQLGVAKRVANTNFYELTWDLGTSVSDGMYTITARISDFGSSDSTVVEVNRATNPVNFQNPPNGDTKAPYEWASLTAPKTGGPLGFVSRTTTLAGTASMGAGGVELFYTTATVSQKPAWKPCGVALRPVGAGATWNFTASCQLAALDRIADVAAVGVRAFKCQVDRPDCANPSPSPLPGTNIAPARQGALEAGDAIGVVACEGSPCIVLRPNEWQANQATCIPLSAHVVQTTRPSVQARVAIEFQGPTDRIRFCNPLNALDDTWGGQETVESDPHGPDRHRIEGFTSPSGVFNFGVFSEDSNFSDIFSAEAGISSVTAWVDDGDHVLEPAEAQSRTFLHWELPGRCTVVGTERSEVLVGTVNDDKVCGRGGNDVIFAQEGDDIILGGEGDDTIHGDEGKDALYGEGGADDLRGGPGADVLDGGTGADRCDSGRGKDKRLTIACENFTAVNKRKQTRSGTARHV